MSPIPSFLASPAILPPFTGSGPVVPSARSPYRVSMEEVVARFASSKQRQDILKGLLSYRRKLRHLQLGAEFQWLAGSFVENPGREPRDIDVVTFYKLTLDQIKDLRNDQQRWQDLQGLADAQSTKMTFLCDAYLVNMSSPSATLVSQVHYWYGLFSHQRGSLAWKGMLEVQVESADDDMQAEELISSTVIL
jgi:hypothetical protein